MAEVLMLAMQMEATRVMNQIDEADRMRIHTIHVEEACVRVVCPSKGYRTEYMFPTVFRSKSRASAQMFECALWLHVVQTSLVTCDSYRWSHPSLAEVAVESLASLAHATPLPPDMPIDLRCDEDDAAIMQELFPLPDPSTTVVRDDELMLHSPVMAPLHSSRPTPSPFKDTHCQDATLLSPVSPIPTSALCADDDGDLPPFLLLEVKPPGVSIVTRYAPFHSLTQSVPFPS